MAQSMFINYLAHCTVILTKNFTTYCGHHFNVSPFHSFIHLREFVLYTLFSVLIGVKQPVFTLPPAARSIMAGCCDTQIKLTLKKQVDTDGINKTLHKFKLPTNDTQSNTASSQSLTVSTTAKK